MPLARIDPQAASDAIGDLARSAVPDLPERRLSAGPGCGREDAGEILLEGVGGPFRERCGTGTLILREVADLANEIGLSLGIDAFDLEASLAAGDDERAPAGQRSRAHDPSGGPDAVRFGAAADLQAALDEHDAEWRLVRKGALQHESVPGLEDVQRQEHPGEQDAPKGEQRERSGLGLGHGQTVLCGLVTTVLEILTPEVLGEVIALADGPGVRGIAVLGSAARGDASAWSDIDVEATVAHAAESWSVRPSFLGTRLVMCSSITAEQQLAQLVLPDKAIWAVPSYAAMRVLVDRDGALDRLQRIARSFDYAILRPAATTYVREKAASACEYGYKIRDAVERRDESKALHAAAALTARSEGIVAAALLTPIRTENEYYRTLQSNAGPAWAAAHRAAFGLGGGDAFDHARAAGRLFRETIRLVDDRLDARSRDTVARTLAILP